MNTYILYIIIAVLSIVMFILLGIVFRFAGNRSVPANNDWAVQLSRLEKIDKSLDDLNRIFLLPYSRGEIGEIMLYDLLANYLPKDSFSSQYRFPDGSICDAVIFLGQYKICVDSKFPLNSIQESLDNGKKQEFKKTFIRYIDDISAKYIQPSQGTLGFALMYVPSEKIYYEAFVRDNENLLARSLEKNIIPAGPSSLFLYVQTVSYGLRGFMLSDEQKNLRAMIAQLKTDIAYLSKTSDLAQNHLKNMVKAFDDNRLALRKTEQDISQLP